MLRTHRSEDALPKQVVVILGPGRSGTSLIMQSLKAMGMQVSGNLIAANESNPRGFYEDEFIVDCHKRLIAEFSPNPAVPMPDGWMSSKIAKNIRADLQDIVNENVKAAESFWGFKDPRTSSFLPLWTTIFNKLKVVPKYILASRNPGEIVRSFQANYGTEQSHAELVLTLRTIEAIRNTGGNCLLINYDNWFSETINNWSLLRPVFHGHEVNQPDAKDILTASLNRASSNPITIQNRRLKSLYDLLLKSSDGSVPNEALRLSSKIYDEMQYFSPWSNEANRQYFENKRLENKIEKLERRVSEKEISFKRVDRLRMLTQELYKAIDSYDRVVSYGKK